MIILGIETSCDETAVAVYDCEKSLVLAERIASQVKLHARFGGVVPEIASREHLTALPGMAAEVLLEAGLDWSGINTIAVTAGPGLMGALLVGTSFARAAALINNIPVVPVHHLEGHLLAPGLTGHLPEFPFITLLVSGGHTLLLRVEGLGEYILLGQSLDDAAGECFDKTARLLGLDYPGGPVIETLAVGGDAGSFPLPRPLLHRKDCNFSFSGLKTAVMQIIRKNAEKRGDLVWQRNLAASFQAAVADVLVAKAVRACREQALCRLVVAGGVAANGAIRDALQIAAGHYNFEVSFASPKYCTDNAAMIAYAACRRIRAGASSPSSPVLWDAEPRWPLQCRSPG